MKATLMKFNLQRIIRPNVLSRGDTIGIVAPAGPFNKSPFDVGIKLINEMGFNTRIDPGVYERDRYMAGDDTHRAERFNAMMADDGVQAVMCARGGYGAMRILDQLDYDTIGRKPKPLIGFSDITALHLVIQLKTGLVTFHGPMVTSLAQLTRQGRRMWCDALTGSRDFSTLFSDLRVLKAGSAEGIIAGGNLATLCHMVGTPYGVDYSGVILMIEDVGEAPYRIDRMITQMKLAGVLDGIVGLVLGRFKDCGRFDEIDEIVMERFNDMDIPIVSGAPFGHGRENMIVPLGVPARLDAGRGELSLLEPVFRE
ncbi:MAG: LD-carboxypeptidase [Desulfobacteraceae bacterium]